MNRTARWVIPVLSGLVAFLVSCVVLALLSDIIVDAAPGDEVRNSGGKVALSLVLLVVGFVLACGVAILGSRLARRFLVRA